MEQPTGKIFLNENRGHNETSFVRTLSTFNFGVYHDEHRTAFGALYTLNDDTVAPGCYVKLHIAEPSYLLILPVVGRVEYADAGGDPVIVEAGQLYMALVPAGTLVTIKNPLDDALVNYLQLRIRANDTAGMAADAMVSFDIDGCRNRFADLRVVYGDSLYTSLPFYTHIGKLSGRKEVEYALRKKENGVFVFIIQGAFEVQNRLLQPRDGLALWQETLLEMEALSNDAIVLLIELPL